MEEPMTNKELESILPSIHTMLHALDNQDFHNYEEKLNGATGKAIDALEEIIDNQTLSMDPEQLVNAVKVLTKAKTDILESKRRLYDTCIKGEVMIKALEQDKGKDKKDSDVLLEYLQKNQISQGDVPNTPASVFETISKEES